MVNIRGHNGIDAGYLRQRKSMEQARHYDEYKLQEGSVPQSCNVAWSLVGRYVVQLFHLRSL